MAVAKKYQEELKDLCKQVKMTNVYFKPNYDRYHSFRNFVFNTSIDAQQAGILDAQGHPQLEFNITEAFISRLRGEFSKQQPSISVMADDGAPVDQETIDVVEGHLCHLVSEANKNGCEYKVYTDGLSGGFSVLKVWTEYAHPRSFNQVIKFDRVFDPTLCGFDPLARTPHKGDGRFCFELYPKSRSDFEKEYSHVDISNLSFTREMDGFSWSYQTQDEDILLLCDFYKKKKKKVKIVQLADDSVMTMDEYEEFLIEWDEAVARGEKIDVAPAIKGKPRWTIIDTICRYVFIESEVIEYTETNFRHLPLVFVDGNSIELRQGESGESRQMTRPYVYHAKGIQQLKNFAGQSLANELENMVQHKFMISKQSIPSENVYLEAYTDVQKANTLVYNEFLNDDPNIRLTAPREIQRVPIPPEVTNTFSIADQTTQMILGSFDAALGINDNQLSGVAIIEGATQSNSAAMPFVVGFLMGLSQVANILVDLFPKYYLTPRTIPVLGKDGSKQYVEINKNGGVKINYDENALQVKVEAGVNFALQKSRSLQQIIAMSSASKIFAEFINTKGLKVLVKNMEVHSSDELEELAEEFMKELEQMKKQPRPDDPMVLREKNAQMKLQLDAKQNEMENQISAAELSIEKLKADNERMKILSNMQNEQIHAAVAMDGHSAEKSRAAVDLAIKTLDMKHSHTMDIKKHEHEVHKSQKEKTV
jgi:hypothetical protein